MRLGLTAPLLHRADHEVIRFSSSSWSDNVDISLCETMGMRDKLAAEIVETAGSAAYRCQCAWQTVGGRKGLSSWGVDAAPHGGSGSDGKIY